jgi:hypothetical protein
VIRRGLVVALCAARMAGARSGGDDDGSGPGEEGAGGPADPDTGDGGERPERLIPCRRRRQPIIESGGGCDRLQHGDDARAAGAAFLEAAGCADIACLRRLPSDAVVAAGFDPGLVADGVRLSGTGRDRAPAGADGK